ncbi:sedoheptulose-1,7-bisphosphatase [Lentithecium fluviatile CBS 122367]|uniref:fructose-bisphosphatase n=1 Tax=Lentithecium fluviatile CBS 122367 TaxID=1168545 RepID=A0A6G1JJB7_9PLEO|nr:sedoheptulose-1,7-bisphosphatase [Lentithecium fluviatile CBS 122367]
MAEPHHPDLETHLQSLIPSPSRSSLRDSVIPALLQSISKIATALRTSSKVSQVGTANAFGDDQLNVDVIAEDIIRTAISKCPSIATASSEEDPVEKAISSVENAAEKYTLAFDPLDGSSIIAPNWTVGTIVGIWEGGSALNQSPDRQIAAILGVYGPRTAAIVALRIPGSEDACFEVDFGDEASDLRKASMEVVRPRIHLESPPFKTRYFAPANLRAAAEDPKYMDLVTRFIAQKYTLRYSGGLVPDVVHALVKGHGVYISPITAASQAKLRRLYELAPIALIIECAGGSAVESKSGERILESEVKDTDERGGLICGTKEEVEEVVKALLG